MSRFDSSPDSVIEQVWASREHELSALQQRLRSGIIHDDSLWDPRLIDTVTEMFWHRARLDAAEIAGQLLIAGGKINPREIAEQTVPEGLSLLNGNKYKGVDGEILLRSEIVDWNEMIEAMLPKEEGEK